MNNHLEVIVNGKSFNMTFGMMAYFEFNKRVADSGTGNFILSTVNLLYAAHMNWCAIKQKPNPSFEEVFEITESLFDSEEGFETLRKIQEFYVQSVAGKKIFTDAQEIKKKVEVEKIPVPDEVQSMLSTIQ